MTMSTDTSDIDVGRPPVVVDLPTAARLLGIGRTSAYELVWTGQWPTPVIRAGRLIRVPTAPLLAAPWTRRATVEAGPHSPPERPPHGRVVLHRAAS